MSYDIYIEKTCNHCQHKTTLRWFYTSKMPHLLEGLDGKLASECVAVLSDGIAALEREPELYRATNPDNGRGSYEDLITHLKHLLKMLENFPDAVVQVLRY